MHREAREWVAKWATPEPVTVLDLGGYDINGTCRDLFPNATYTVLDNRPGPGVDIVADAAAWAPDRTFDIVLSTEVFEHTPDWAAICRTAHASCAPGGRFIVTCAGPGRPRHGATGTPRPMSKEWYRNIEPDELASVLRAQEWREIQTNQWVNDLRATAVR